MQHAFRTPSWHFKLKSTIEVNGCLIQHQVCTKLDKNYCSSKSKIKIVTQVFLHGGKLGLQNSLYQNTTCCMCDCNFSETNSSQLFLNITLNFARSSGHLQSLHQNVFCSQILKLLSTDTDVQHGLSPCQDQSAANMHIFDRKTLTI